MLRDDPPGMNPAPGAGEAADFGQDQLGPEMSMFVDVRVPSAGDGALFLTKIPSGSLW